ncbi:MAG TPA: tRNA preQ1(34) S-adenosylmethionine ribosyltransferase-isomerase QueA, partial [Treponemataceae bacterium]|nr:tRNA preQ1(34) S-adenosylmethionine ribosyltransferase-isomerase QueA [Treponemataceae bacterium]
MKTKDFYFNLPEELVAQYPSKKRGEDKLMILNRHTGNIENVSMNDFPRFVEPGTLMIFNNSRVRRSRCFAKKITPMIGGQGNKQQAPTKEIEFMILNQISKKDDFKISHAWKCMVKNAKKQKVGNTYIFSDGTIGTIVLYPEFEKTEFRAVVFNKKLDEMWFEKNGHIPLPPYIKREDTEEDSDRYQNVYAEEIGSAACPTAGLHFTDKMMQKLQSKNIEIAFVTLHVGLGTFLPVREENIEEHAMHEEIYTLSEETAQKVYNAKKEGRKIVAVGTTTVRTLESAWKQARENKRLYLQTGTHCTNIFIYPGKKMHVIDQLFTNFHTPESTLLMLVSAFAGKEYIFNAYNEAIKQNY